jgi:uncharacterized protein
MIEKLARMLGEGSGLYPHKAEAKYPRVVEKISILWGTVGMSRYFTEILFDDRGDREGFPPEVMLELFALSNYHEATRPSRSAIESAWESGEGDRLDRFKDQK